VDQLVKKALEFGLVVRNGRQFSPLDQPENALRIGFASLNREEIRQATARLAQAAAAIAP
jgi:GntR family transcriptional regulator / MocR family aminotransferase